MKTGLLLINLGTPDAPTFMGVWRYLRQFLSDKRVVSLPAPLRLLLLYGVILPFRVAKTKHAYQAIWTERGSPLRYHGEDLVHKLQQYLGNTYRVVLAMRYGNPSIEQALIDLQYCDRLMVLPLYPQYSSAASGSSLEAVFQSLASQTCIPNLRVMRQFYQAPAYIQAQAQCIAPHISGHEMLVFSYHGLPEQQIQQTGCEPVCKQDCVSSNQDIVRPNCYRAQCYHTSLLLAQALQLQDSQYTTAFQSRLGRIPWIQPYLDTCLDTLAAQGVKRIAVACPSFVADCLETLEEIGMRMRALWIAAGGEQMTLIPCLNTDEEWCKAIVSFL